MQAQVIRRLGSDDKLAFRQMNALFAKAFADPKSYTGEPPSDEYVSALLSREHVIALVSVQDDEVVGGLVAYELEKFERERLEIYIYDLAVDERHRRCGIATALIEHLREIARNRGAWVIYVQADFGDHPAISLYTKLGDREDVIHFDISVEQ